MTDKIQPKTLFSVYKKQRRTNRTEPVEPPSTGIVDKKLFEHLTALTSEQRPLALARALTTQVLQNKFKLTDQQSPEYQRLHRLISQQIVDSPELAALLLQLNI